MILHHAFLGEAKGWLEKLGIVFQKLQQYFPRWHYSHIHTIFDAKSPHFEILKRYTVQHVDETRMELFCHENKAMENIPPTSDAVLQDVKRVAYQASVWATSQNSQQKRITPEFGDGNRMNVEKNGFLFGSPSQ